MTIYKVDFIHPPKVGLQMRTEYRGAANFLEVDSVRSWDNKMGGVSTLILWVVIGKGRMTTSALRSKNFTPPSSELVRWIRGYDASPYPPSRDLNPRSTKSIEKNKVEEKTEKKGIDVMAGFKFKKKHVPKRMGDDLPIAPGGVIQQTVKRDGQRVVIRQSMGSDGKIKTKVTKAHTLEDDIQESQANRLKGRSDYNIRFTFAADQNGTLRGPVAQRNAKRTGMMAGEPDVRLSILDDYGDTQTVYVENKNGGGKVSDEQIDRHHILRKLGLPVYIIKTDDKALAADLIEDVLDYHMSGCPLPQCKELFSS